MNAATASAPLTVAQIRRQVYETEAKGRPAEARSLLVDLMGQLARPDPELLADLAAMALRDGDLVQAIHCARAALVGCPDHDSSRFTLGLSLAAIGSYQEALVQLAALTEGSRGDRFRQMYPELATMAVSEVERLRIQVPTPAAAFQDARADGGGKYDLSHLVQPLDQQVGGPVQDDEALLLYAMVRCMRVRRVLEIGGLSG